MSDSPITLRKQQALLKRMAALGISERDLVEQFILGSGRGGQKLNKTSSCVRLKHASSGTVVKCGQSRSREVNRFMARRLLCDRIEEIEQGAESERRKKANKIRRQKRRRTRRQKERILEDKRRQSEKKRLRAPPADE